MAAKNEAREYLGGKQLTLAEADALRQRLEEQGEPELAGKVAERLRAQAKDQARSFLAGKQPTFADTDALWRRLKKEDELPLARAVLERLRLAGTLSDGLPAARATREELCQQLALLTSKDAEIHAGARHDRALEVLAEVFNLADPALDGDAETLGIAGGISKRRWEDLGQLEDLRAAADFYRRGAKGDLGDDAYAHINAAFLEDLLAEAGDAPQRRRQAADALRKRIVGELPVQTDNWWNAASRAEAHLGLGNYKEATEAIRIDKRPAPWELQTTARQLARLAHLRAAGPPASNPELAEFFRVLLGGSAEAVHSTFIGKVGLGLSGGGFRSAFYHLGVLARLAELDVLRHLDVLSCVSGGSIIGACYWLSLRRRLLAGGQGPVDYVRLVRGLIEHFEAAVARGLREQLQGKQEWLAPGPLSKAADWMSRLVIARRLVRDKGALDSEGAARLLEEQFFRPLMPGTGELTMDQLLFQPADHDPVQTGAERFHPTRHNWLRTDNVPALVLNATTVNTGHAWQFTVTWMGESPWAVHEVADTVPRLEWHDYDAAAGWRMGLGRAVAASAGVPGIFSPMRIAGVYEDLDVELVDGGVYDNQGAAALLAHSCNLLLISDAAGQLELERRSKSGVGGLAAFFMRSMDAMMERIRQASFGELTARRQSGLLRGLMFLHMKDGLATDPIPLPFSEVPVRMERSPLTPAGIRRDFQQAIAELRTDLNRFTPDEGRSLMACGYRMAAHTFERDLRQIAELEHDAPMAEWPFAEQLQVITRPGALDARGEALLAALRRGREVPG